MPVIMRLLSEHTASLLMPLQTFPGDTIIWPGSWLRARTARYRDGRSAVRLAKRASELTGHRYHGILDTLAGAYAEVGEFAKAAESQANAVRVAPDEVKKEYQYNLERYRVGQTWAKYPRGASADFQEMEEGRNDGLIADE